MTITFDDGDVQRYDITKMIWCVSYPGNRIKDYKLPKNIDEIIETNRRKVTEIQDIIYEIRGCNLVCSSDYKYINTNQNSKPCSY